MEKNVKLLSIASGSSGNCTYIGFEHTHILIDTGITTKKIEEGLKELEINGKDVSAIFITHEHIDHIQGLGVFLRKYQTPVYASKGTIHGILKSKGLGKVDVSLFHPIEVDQVVEVGSLKIAAFEISHDALEPFAFIVQSHNKKIAVCTDIGSYNDVTIEHLQDLDAILLEANHDIKMVQVGPYPYYLKQRILSNIGHLSNENAGRLLNKIIHKNLQWIILGHLSKDNNMPELAYEAVRMEITLGETPYSGEDFNIVVARGNDCVQIIEI